MGDSASFGFLGEEFLTWLWFRLEDDGGEFDLGDGLVVGVSMDDFLEFAPLDDDETQQTMRKGMPTRSSEARSALRSGHRLRKAKLVIARGELQWAVTIDGTEMGLRSVKLPDDDPEAESAAERDRERAANFLLLHDIVRRLYRTFLKLRLRRDYLKSDAERQAQWMASE